MISAISLFKVRSCLKYHAAGIKRKRILQSIHAGAYDHASRDMLADMCVEALKVGCTTGIYGMEFQAIGEEMK